MALRDEQADILGGPILQRPESGLFSSFSRHHSTFKSATLLALGLVVWVVCVRGLEHLKKHRELRYRKAMRRKHGIPDSDCRPFAVAYAAAKRAHAEREAQDRKKTTNYVSDHNLPVVDQRTDAQKDARGMRRRVPETSLQLHDYQPPRKHATAYDNKHTDLHSPDLIDRYNPQPRRVTIPERSSTEKPLVHLASRKNFVINIDNNEESRKRSFEGESDVQYETIKKSRMDGNELMGGNEQADWYNQQVASRRSSKEFLGRSPAGNHACMDDQERSKCVVDEDHEPLDEAMEDITEGEVVELKAVARGKKRGRAEAGSAFGGDDDEDARNGRILRHRKRRTVSRKKIEIPVRGQKRDREADSPVSEGEGGGSKASRAQPGSKKKRGKKAVADEVDKVSVEDPCVSKDPLCNGRRVGDEWEADGVQYRVSTDGGRLRLALVKKARNKYHMPQDSQHSDRSAALEIYVETWMTDEQYKQAERREELAWQEGPLEPSGFKTPDVPSSPTKNGKNLLWDSAKGSPARRPFRQLMPASTSTHMNPFEQWQLQPTLGRRVASSSAVVSPGSSTRLGYRSFSKWEKQDREAEALARIRAKIEEQKRVQAPSQKSAEIPTSITAPDLGTKSLTVPTITFTPAPVAGGDSNISIPQSKLVASTSSGTPLNTRDSVKGASTTTSTATGVSPASTSMVTAVSSTLSLGAPTAPATTSSAVPLSPLSFSIPPVSTSAASLSSATPNPFEKGSDAGMTSAPTPLPFTLGITTQPQPPSTESTSRPTLSSFAKSGTAPSIASPPTIKSQSPNYGDPSGSSPLPVTLGSTPAAAKAEVPTRPPIPTSTTMFESSKSTAPLFSFSGTSSSSTATHPTSLTSSAPKFSFGQPPATSTFPPSSNLQPKPVFKFGQTTPSATGGDAASTVQAADAPKKSAVPVSIFDAATGTHEPAKSTLNPTSAFSNKFSGKPITAEGGPSTPSPPRPTSGSANTVVPDYTQFSVPAVAPASGNTPVFSFSGTNSTSKPTEGTRSTSLFGSGAGGSNPILSSSFAEQKPAFGLNVPADSSKSSSTFGDNAEAPKPPVFRSSAESSQPTFTFSGVAEGLKPTFAFGGVTGNKSMPGPVMENTKSFNAVDTPKPTSAPGITTVGPSSSPLTFTFGKGDAITNTSTSTGTQPKPTTPFTFGAPPGVAKSVFGQPSASSASGDSSQSIFGKPTPNAFGFAGSANSNSPGTFTFGKPAAQNQKQEQ